MTTRVLAAVTVLAMIAVLQVSPAVADAKVFHPAICNAVNPADNQFIYRGFNSIGHNGTTGYFSVFCGLVRDNTLNTNGLAGFKVKVFNQVTCSFSSVDTNGVQIQVVTESSGAGAGSQILDWGASINTSVNGGLYVLGCTVYPNSAIDWIFMNEY